MMKTYRGLYLNGKISVSVCTDGPTVKVVHELDPGPSQKLWNHSPDGFNWGYEGSGPAQLALALLLDHTHNKDLAVRLHQLFKRDVIARLPQRSDWELSAEQIEAWLAKNEKSGTE